MNDNVKLFPREGVSEQDDYRESLIALIDRLRADVVSGQIISIACVGLTSDVSTWYYTSADAQHSVVHMLGAMQEMVLDYHARITS